MMIENHAEQEVLESVSFARSQTVDLHQITFAKECARPYLVGLGSYARCLQIIDLNRQEAPHALPHTRQIKLCDASLSKLHFLVD